jgi:maleylpyruvate isomerase
MQPYRVLSSMRSSAAWRLRIALKLKGLPYEEIFHDLNAGAQDDPAFRAVNPQGLVPALVCPDGLVVTQSMAIIEYLDEAHPLTPLLPRDAAGRARVRALAQIVACEMHPVNNLRVRNHVRDLKPDDPRAMSNWIARWSGMGLAALEALLDDPRTGRFCHGDEPTLADVFLVPQVNHARTLGPALDPYPIVLRVTAACEALRAFEAARPERQTAGTA